jgi:hypothetical protein
MLTPDHLMAFHTFPFTSSIHRLTWHTDFSSSHKRQEHFISIWKLPELMKFFKEESRQMGQMIGKNLSGTCWVVSYKFSCVPSNKRPNLVPWNWCHLPVIASSLQHTLRFTSCTTDEKSKELTTLSEVSMRQTTNIRAHSSRLLA